MEAAIANLFRLSYEHWAVIETSMPKDQPGPERKDDRLIIYGIFACSYVGLLLARLPHRLRPAHRDLQALQPLVAARLLEPGPTTDVAVS